MLQKILIYPNQKRDLQFACTKRAASFFMARQIEVYMPEETAQSLRALQVKSITEEKKPEMDLAIVLGGDGTMIQAAHFLLGQKVPILGINLGTLGYLTEVEPANLEASLELLLEQGYQVEERLILEAEVRAKGSEAPKRIWAVNDLVIHRNLMDGLLTVNTYVNDDFLAEFRADGVIVSSPCGSTAYNFSAGGPILNPVADNLILTPLCSHAMLDRSIVLMGSDRLSFRIGASGKGQEALLSADGVGVASLAEGSWIRVQKSDYTFPMVKLLQRSFYEVLQKKMKP